MSKTILCVIEIDENKIKKSSLEFMTAAMKIKDYENCKEICAVVLNETPQNFKNELFSYGFDKVYGLPSSLFNHYRTQAYSAALQKLISKLNPDFVLIPSTCNGRDLGPYLAVLANASIIADVTDITKEGNDTIYIRPIYVGNLISYNKFTKADGVKILPIRSKAFLLPEATNSLEGEYIEEKVELGEENVGNKVLEVVK